MFNKNDKEQSLLEELRDICTQINNLKVEINKIEKLPKIPISWREYFNYLPDNQKRVIKYVGKDF